MIYGASFDTPDENKKFAEKFSFNFPLLSVDAPTAQAYGAADPDQTGGYAKRVGVLIGPDGKVREYSPKVDAASYPSEILTRI